MRISSFLSIIVRLRLSRFRSYELHCKVSVIIARTKSHGKSSTYTYYPVVSQWTLLRFRIFTEILNISRFFRRTRSTRYPWLLVVDRRELYDFVKLVAYYTRSMYMYSMYTYAYATRVERNCDDLRRARIPAKPTKKSEKRDKERRKKKKRNRKKRESFGILGRMNLVFCKRETREYRIFWELRARSV